MLKFRTMVADAEELLPQLVSFDGLAEPVFKLRRRPAHDRGGPAACAGRASTSCRSSSTCCVGEMSLVGPRPEQLELVERYTPEQRLRLASSLASPGRCRSTGAAD